MIRFLGIDDEAIWIAKPESILTVVTNVNCTIHKENGGYYTGESSTICFDGFTGWATVQGNADAVVEQIRKYFDDNPARGVHWTFTEIKEPPDAQEQQSPQDV